MFKYLISILTLACVACLGFLYMKSADPFERTVPEKVSNTISDFTVDQLEIRKNIEPSKEARVAASSEEISLEEVQNLLSKPKEDKNLINETDCLVFYPFIDGRLPDLHQLLSSSLIGRIQIHEFDRLRYHIEVAPSSNKKVWAKRRAEIKGNFPNSVESDDRSMLRIASISSKHDARTIADVLSKKFLDVKVSIREENFAKGKVALVFGGLSTDENQSLRKLLIPTGSNLKVDACSSFEQ